MSASITYLTFKILYVKQFYISFTQGKFIPSTQRPDGTWRKARRVKDGYVPQEEVPLYESKGKQFAKKPDLPVGMCPAVAQASRDKRDKEQQKQQKIAGLIVLNKQQQQQTKQQLSSSSSSSGNTTLMCASNSNNSSSISTGAISKNITKSTKKQQQQQPNHNNINHLTTSMANIEISEDELAKQLKKLRKRLRKIEQMEEKLNAGELKSPEPEQIEKLASKSDCVKQIEILEKRLLVITQQQQELSSSSHKQLK